MSDQTRFEKLLEPFQIGGVKLRNRMVKPAQGLGYATEDGYVTERFTGFYETIAKGGVGLIIMEICCVDYPIGESGPHHLAIDKDAFIPGLSELTKVIHQHGCPTFAQLGHAGPRHPTSLSGLQPIASSTLTADEMPAVLDLKYSPVRGLSLPEIEGVVAKFVAGAERAKKAGFDGVEIHACHDYLINSFISRIWNKRQDAYGCQDLTSRSRILVEIIRGIKARLGQDYPVTVRINGGEFGHSRGTTSEESQAFGKILEQAGANAIQISAWGYGEFTRLVFPEQILFPEPPQPLPQTLDISRGGAGGFLPMIAAIKKGVSIPVIAAGRFDPVLAEQVIREGKADIVSFGRRLFADPELPNKLKAGRLEDIAPCTACLECRNTRSINEGVRCRINARIGREREYTIQPAGKKKKVLVVGGGPSGMEAARVAALRGHQVMLYDKASKLGGLLPLAAMIKGVEVEDLPDLVRYLETQVRKLGVTVRLGSEVTESVIAEIKPDVLVLATGGKHFTPEIPGIKGRKVLTAARLHRMSKTVMKFLGPKTLASLTKLWMPIGKRVVIVGGTMHGCELAEFLVKRGRQVTMVEASDEIGAGMVTPNRGKLLPWLSKKGVTMLAGVKYDRITDKGLEITTKDGVKRLIEADTVLIAAGLKSNSQSFANLKDKVADIRRIGDCEQPGLIVDAVEAGFITGNTI